MRQHVVRIALGLIVVALFVGDAAKSCRVEFVARFDHLLYDTRLRLTVPGGVDDRIVILDIDERSLATPDLRCWPRGRDVQAGLVRRFFEKCGVALVAFDVVNAERDRSSGLPVLERLATGELKDVREFEAEFARLNAAFKARGWKEIRIGIGLYTGPMNAGDMGSRLRKAYTVMGDTARLAFRVEGLTNEYGPPISVGHATREAVTGIVFRELDRVRAKGKDEPVAIFEPIGPENEVGKERVEELKLWGQAPTLHRARNWDQAELILFNLQRLYPGAPLYSLYADRVARYRHASPGPAGTA